MKFETTVTNLGTFSEGLNKNNVVILFDEDSTDYLKNFAFLHHPKGLNEEIKLGDTLFLDGHPYTITELGANVNKSLDTIGHVSIELESDENESAPNIIIVEGDPFPTLDIGSTIQIA